MIQFREDLLLKIKEAMFLCTENDESERSILVNIMRACAEEYCYVAKMDGRFFSFPIKMKGETNPDKTVIPRSLVDKFKGEISACHCLGYEKEALVSGLMTLCAEAYKYIGSLEQPTKES